MNWCPSCNTVLANEQVQEGCCERCGTPVVKKDLTQWFFKITDYAEELLSGLDKLDWPEKTKLMQRNWIGKSVGCEIEFTCESGDTLKVFTTRPDTVFGVSYVVLAPEHPLVRKLASEEQRAAVEAYIENTAKTNEIDRLSSSREKTGVFIGHYAINPVNGEKVPSGLRTMCSTPTARAPSWAFPRMTNATSLLQQSMSCPLKKSLKTAAAKPCSPSAKTGSA